MKKTAAKKRNLISSLTLLSSCLGLFALGLCYSSIENSVWSIVWKGYDAVFTFVNVLCIYVLSLNWKKDSWVINGISGNTLGIYFVHLIVIYIVRPALVNCTFLFNTTGTFAFSFFVLAVSLMICRLMRKCPVISELVK